MIKLAVCIPSAGSTPIEFSECFSNMMARLPHASFLKGAGSNVSILRAVSTNWISNREKLVMAALEQGVTHILWLDDDMMFHPDVVQMLFSRDRDIVIANYLVKTQPADTFTSYDLEGRNIITRPESTGLVEAAFGGFGVSLIKADVFRRVPQPWFLPKFDQNVLGYSTEDLPFFEKARECGYKVWVDQDVSKRVGHVGRKIWFYTEWVEPEGA